MNGNPSKYHLGKPYMILFSFQPDQGNKIIYPGINTLASMFPPQKFGDQDIRLLYGVRGPCQQDRLPFEF